ncbi:hypothetical protein ACFWYW_47105 [Nonomuraea sp. NPDC059023]|uniref:Lsr2 family DNA-binding protein n=1 Tax=unclassified Nonomuraea TaxID=2593643 RepID=UPI0036C34ACD
MTATVADHPTAAPPGITPEFARALRLLSTGSTAHAAASKTGVRLGRLIGLARRQGWTIHPATQLATDPLQPGGKPALDSAIAQLADTWTNPGTAITPDAAPSADESSLVGHEDAAADAALEVVALLDDARASTDTYVQAALRRVEEAIRHLRDALHSAKDRVDAAAEVAELEAQLAAARQRLQGLKPTLAAIPAAKTARKPKPGRPGAVATDADIRRWALANRVPVSERGRVAREARDAYENAHPGQASAR